MSDIKNLDEVKKIREQEKDLIKKRSDKLEILILQKD